MHYALMERAFRERESGLGFHLHNGRTTNAFCINSGDLMVAAEAKGTVEGMAGGAVITQS